MVSTPDEVSEGLRLQINLRGAAELSLRRLSICRKVLGVEKLFAKILFDYLPAKLIRVMS
jgi:hypothetical protein